MPKCYQLIGVPGSGKSTWVAHQEWADKCAYISTDTWVEIYARDMRKTYNEVFNEYMPIAIELMVDEVVVAREASRDIIWDQTSTTVKSRKKKFNMLPDYEHIAVVFRTPKSEELAKRLASRPGKNIPEYVVRTMIDGWEEPTHEEGFIEIRYA
jgi:predicted kinase